LHAHAGTLVNATAPTPATGQATLRMRVRNSIITAQGPRPLPDGYRIAGPPAAIRHNNTAHTGRTHQPPSTALIVTGLISGTVALAAAAYLIGQLIELIAAHAAQIIGALVLLAIIAALAARGSGRRRHCPGC
jgi:hypothetical protein